AYRFVDDTETPVSAFLKLRGSGPAFLLESAEQGRLGRYSFLGFQPRAVLRWSDGVLSEWTGAELATAGEAGAWGDPTASRAAEAKVAGGGLRPPPARRRIPRARSPSISTDSRRRRSGGGRRSRAAPSATSATTSCARSSRSASRTRTRSGFRTWC